ncbi:MAG TPA: SusC/RagA family TonB-linked outer membrane protein, partial [Cyclobacteriaceae bacterium]
MKRVLHVIFLCLLSLGYAQSQDRTITGRVTADDGSPIPGVNILIKGSSQGTVTDGEGKYTLNVPASGGTLVFSFIGLLSQEREIGDLAVLDVQMAQDVTQLGEVVVTGYGDQEVRSISGSVSKVGSERIGMIPLADVSRTLQGNVAGLFSTGGSGTPGAATQVRIRGIGSATASAEPLYVLDGIPIQTADLTTSTATANPLANINPNDIENVVVMKDAAATALYGSRGSNGVVLITTKSGKAGATRISLHAQHGFSDQAYQEYERLNASEYVMLRKEAYLNSGGNPANADAFAGSDAIDTDWGDVVFRTGKTRSYDVSAQGGDEKTKFFISGGYYKQEGITIYTDFERFSARFNIDHQATDKLLIGLNMTPTYSKQVSTSQGSNFNSLVLQSMLLAPNVPVKNDDGTYFAAFPGVLGESSPGANDGYNPVAITSLDRNDNNVARLIGKVYGSYEILKGLSFRTDLSVDLYDGVEQIYQNSQFGDGASVSGRSTFDTQRNLIWQSTSTLTYNTTISNVHNITGVGVFEAIERSLAKSTLAATTFANDKLINAVSGATPETASSTETASSLMSYLLIARYDFNKKYFLSASFRRDGSSRFGADVKFGNFWSLGGSWMVTDESFMEGISFLNSLKLRAGFGTTGNENIGDFQSQGLFQPSAYNGESGFNPSQIANPKLTWEKSKQFNIGVDFAVLGNRLSGTVEWYNRETTDLLFNVPVS